jgi:hypothetical protein
MHVYLFKDIIRSKRLNRNGPLDTPGTEMISQKCMHSIEFRKEGGIGFDVSSYSIFVQKHFQEGISFM